MELLAVIDCQVDFFNGSLGYGDYEKLAEGIAEEIRAAQKRGAKILFTHDTHLPNYLSTREGRSLSVEHTILGSPGWELYGPIKELADNIPDAIHINKATFGMNPWDVARLPEGVDKIRIVGRVSNICVLSNAVMLQARYPEAQIEVVESLTDSNDPQLHKAAMDVLKGLQAKIV